MNRLIFVGLAVVLLSVSGLVVHKEVLIRSGTRVLLKLAPRDPRSLIEGDYMSLNYALSNELRHHTGEPDGFVVLSLDEAGRGELVRVDDGTALGPREVKVRFRQRHGWMQFASDAFYFQEGQGDRFAQAKYGDLRVTAGGEALLVGLCDDQLQPIRSH